MLKALLKNKTRGNRVEFWLKRKGKKQESPSDWLNMQMRGAFVQAMNPMWGQLGEGLNQWQGVSTQANSLMNYVSSTQGAI